LEQEVYLTVIGRDFVLKKWLQSGNSIDGEKHATFLKFIFR
jgi:hypothetical protein